MQPIDEDGKFKFTTVEMDFTEEVNSYMDKIPWDKYREAHAESMHQNIYRAVCKTKHPTLSRACTHQKRPQDYSPCKRDNCLLWYEINIWR